MLNICITTIHVTTIRLLKLVSVKRSNLSGLHLRILKNIRIKRKIKEKKLHFLFLMLFVRL